MVNNINLIKPLLNFDKEGDFYMLYILKRKKDQPEVDIQKKNPTLLYYPKSLCYG